MMETMLLVVAVHINKKQGRLEESDITHYKLENTEIFGGQHYAVVRRQDFLFQLNALKIGNPANDIILRVGTERGAKVALEYQDSWFLTAKPSMSLVDLPQF